MDLRREDWYEIPESCPFTIEEYDIKVGLSSPKSKKKTFLIREHDQYGEYPHIYAKICPAETVAQEVDGEREETVPKVIVLSDTGCGTEVPCFDSNSKRTSSQARRVSQSSRHDLKNPKYPEKWNIFTFLEYTINPSSQIPYLVMTTHCHYDHIMGIGKFPPTEGTHAATAAAMDAPGDWRSGQPPPITVLTSSRDKAFVTPYSNLQKHSLAGTLGLCAPEYEVGIWADDFSQVVYSYPRPSSPSSPSTASQSQPEDPCMVIQIPTPYTILHTPGHTPDSLSWYDADQRVLCVGDSFYLKEAAYGAPWGDEPPAPTMFNLESNLADWWRSVHKVLNFVVQKNRELGKEVKDNRPEPRDRIRDGDGRAGGGDGDMDRQPGTAPKVLSTERKDQSVRRDTEGTSFVVINNQNTPERIIQTTRRFSNPVAASQQQQLPRPLDIEPRYLLALGAPLAERVWPSQDSNLQVRTGLLFLGPPFGNSQVNTCSAIPGSSLILTTIIPGVGTPAETETVATTATTPAIISTHQFHSAGRPPHPIPITIPRPKPRPKPASNSPRRTRRPTPTLKRQSWRSEHSSRRS